MAMVTEKMFRVLTGFSKLDYEERNIVLEQINQYQANIDFTKRANLIEAFAKQAGVPLGPTGQSGCPCCGK